MKGVTWNEPQQPSALTIRLRRLQPQSFRPATYYFDLTHVHCAALYIFAVEVVVAGQILKNYLFIHYQPIEWAFDLPFSTSAGLCMNEISLIVLRKQIFSIHCNFYETLFTCRLQCDQIKITKCP